MWFSASLLFQSIPSEDVGRPPLWEDVIVLIEATTGAEAETHAAMMGRSREHEYSVAKPKPHQLRWVFVRVERVCEVDGDTLGHGTELFSRFLRDSEATSLLQPFDD